MIASGELEAVLIASPTPTHVDLIEACIDAELPVLCEKPIDLDIARVDKLRPKVTASQVPVALGFNQRFDPAFAETRARVAAGEIGALEHLSIVSRDPAPPPAEYLSVSGGIFRDMTIHDFDTAMVTLRAPSGAVVTTANSRHSVIGYDQRLEAFGAEGMLQVGNAHSSLVSLSTSEAVETRRPYIELFLERYAAAYAGELAEFVQLARGEASSCPSYDDGRAALIIADAAQLSAEKGIAVRIGLE